MNMNQVRSSALSAWIFLGGPLVWGVFLVWRLKILSPEEFLNCLFPVGFLVLLIFLAANRINLQRQKKQPSFQCGKQTRPVNIYCLMLILFGTLGTASFLILPDVLGGTRHIDKDLLGALAGFSLISMFYPFLSIKLFSCLPDFETTGPALRQFNLYLYGLGLLAYFATAALSPLDWDISNLIGLIIPVFMSVFLFFKAQGISNGPR